MRSSGVREQNGKPIGRVSRAGRFIPRVGAEVTLAGYKTPFKVGRPLPGTDLYPLTITRGRANPITAYGHELPRRLDPPLPSKGRAHEPPPRVRA